MVYDLSYEDWTPSPTPHKSGKNVQAMLAAAPILSYTEPGTKAWSDWPSCTWWGDYCYFIMIIVIGTLYHLKLFTSLQVAEEIASLVAAHR